MLNDASPTRYFVPAYVGHLGWVGVRLDVDAPWSEIASVIEGAYRTRAPATRRSSTTAAAEASPRKAPAKKPAATRTTAARKPPSKSRPRAR